MAAFTQNRKQLSIGVFDSGIGGITTLTELIRELSNENFIYFADKDGSPYGNKDNSYILSRTKEACRYFLRRGVKAIVLACNTATNVAIENLRSNLMNGERALDGSFLDATNIASTIRHRDNYDGCIFVGLEPSVKPAIDQTKSGNILVLLTEATAKQEKFKMLIESLIASNNGFDKKRLIISPQPSLAALVEKNIGNLYSIKEDIMKILDSYQNISSVVLGCTHYIFLREIIDAHYGGRVQIFDGNKGAARRLGNLLCKHNLKSDSLDNGIVEFVTK